MIDLDENGIEWVEINLSHTRKAKGIAMRKSRAKLDSMLTPVMRDASKEISRAYEELESGFGVILNGFLPPAFTRIRGTGRTEIDMDKVDSIRERIKALKNWENLCTPMLRDTVYSLNQTEHTAGTYAEFLNLYTDSKKTKPDTRQVTMWYVEGLRVYCKLKGWA